MQARNFYGMKYGKGRSGVGKNIVIEYAIKLIENYKICVFVVVVVTHRINCIKFGVIHRMCTLSHKHVYIYLTHPCIENYIKAHLCHGIFYDFTYAHTHTFAWRHT